MRCTGTGRRLPASRTVQFTAERGKMRGAEGYTAPQFEGLADSRFVNSAAQLFAQLGGEFDQVLQRGQDLRAGTAQSQLRLQQQTGQRGIQLILQ